MISEKIVHIFLLMLSLMSLTSVSQDTIPLCNFDQYQVIEFNNKFQLIKENQTIIERSNSHDLRLKFNGESGMIFMDTTCLNCVNEQLIFDSFYLNCNNNIQVEIIPINDTLRIVNHFQLSRRCSNSPMRSKQYPNEDSIINNMAVYPAFEFGFTKSSIMSTLSGRTIPIPPALQYDIIADIIVGFELDLDLFGDVKKSWLQLYHFQEGEFIPKTRVEKKYIRSASNIPFKDIHEVSDQITDSRALNPFNFAIKVGEKWYRYSYKLNRSGIGQPGLFKKESKGADSIAVIPFFEPAIIMHYADSSVLEISHSRINGTVRFDTLNITNYFAQGIETYASQEIIVFTYAKNRHIIIYHSNGHPHYGKFKIYEGAEPKAFFDLRWHKLNPEPTKALQILSVNYNTQ